MDTHSPTLPEFAFDNSFSRDLEGCFVAWQAETAIAPKILQFNDALADELGLDGNALNSEAGAAVFSGNQIPAGAEPLAQVYAGHQFGGFSPQLGDGRALLLGEIIDTNGQRRDIQLKGSGRTPYSRNGDGKAALGPVLREYLIGEAMHALGVPTTRALAAVSTGEQVQRETILPGGVLTRVSASHLRVGTFQYFAAQREFDKVRQLADYAIARHHPKAAEADNPYLAFIRSVADVQAKLVAHWMSIGFIHGVMNTDNVTISGETIDYGPCAFMDKYAPGTVFSSIDLQGRYAYGNQPAIMAWNLARLAEALIPLVSEDRDEAVEILTEMINTVPAEYETHALARMRVKLGLTTAGADDEALVNELLTAMEQGSADFTMTFRRLSDAVLGNALPVQNQFDGLDGINNWLERWRGRLTQENLTPEDRAAQMNRVNPIYIPRNHKVEDALSAAVDEDDMSVFENLLAVVKNPFEEVSGQDDYTKPAAPAAIPYQTFCGT